MSEIPIVIAFDENYLMPASVMLVSLFENASSSTKYKIFIFADQKTKQASQQKIQEILKCYPGHAVEWVDPAGNFSAAKNRNHLTRPNYYRFLIPDFLKEYSKALWLDVDMIIKKDLSELFATNLDGFYLGAVLIGLQNASVQQVPSSDYFNAGLLLMNLDLWRKYQVAKTARQLIEENDFSCPIQDPMNLVGYKKTIFLPPIYNVYISPKSMKGKRKREYLAFHGYPSFAKLIDDVEVLLLFVKKANRLNEALSCRQCPII
jgi:lipopolysaccharide biosynthesis glycosyltransferase